MTRAVRESGLPAPARLIVFVLSDIADNDTAVIPAARTLSLTELSHQSGLGRSTVARMLLLLEEAGWVKRDQPESPARARAGEKTRYQLKIGGSPRTGLVPERDYPTRSKKKPPSPTTGLEVVPERDGGSPAAGRKRKNPSKNSLKEPSTAAPSAALQVADTIDAEIIDEPNTALAIRSTELETVNTRQILAAWIDYCSQNQVKLPNRLKGQYADGIKKALDEGFNPDIIKRALASMLADGVASRPSLLPNRLVSAQTGPERWPRRLTPGEVTAARLTDNGQDTVVVGLIQDFFKDVS